MPFNISPTELIIILVTLILVFGPGRISKIGGEMGKGIREFRNSIDVREENVSDEKKAG